MSHVALIEAPVRYGMQLGLLPQLDCVRGMKNTYLHCAAHVKNGFHTPLHPKLSASCAVWKRLYELAALQATVEGVWIVHRPMVDDSKLASKSTVAKAFAPFAKYVHAGLLLLAKWSDDSCLVLLELFPKEVCCHTFPSNEAWHEYRVAHEWSNLSKADTPTTVLHRWGVLPSSTGKSPSITYVTRYLEQSAECRYHEAAYNCQVFVIEIYNANPNLWYWEKLLV